MEKVMEFQKLKRVWTLYVPIFDSDPVCINCYNVKVCGTDIFYPLQLWVLAVLSMCLQDQQTRYVFILRFSFNII